MKHLLVFLLCCCNSLFAQMPPVANWKDKVFDSIFIEKNIVYTKAADFAGDSVSLTLDLYTPKCPRNSQTLSSSPPLMVVIHGGSFLSGNKDEPSIVKYCRDFAARGYLTAAVNYRLGFVNSSGSNNCNFPNYPCFFAADSAEWLRAIFRGVQDVNDALYYLFNLHEYQATHYPEHGTSITTQPDAANVFLVGESAGAFIALGVALMDSSIEKFSQAAALNNLPQPNNNTAACPHNAGKNFPATIARPDLGKIQGNIIRKPFYVKHTIKGVGNMFGALTDDLLKVSHPGSPKPAIFSYHRPCDLVVPVDHDKVYWGLNWCFTNGYNCFAIADVPTVLGSRAISKLNTTNNYGYNIQNHFTNDTFEKQYLLGQYSCVNQTNQSCHGYDNRNLRDSLMADFFAQFLQPAINMGCVEMLGVHDYGRPNQVHVYPNPFSNFLEIDNLEGAPLHFELVSFSGVKIQSGVLQPGKQLLRFEHRLPAGLYLLQTQHEEGFSCKKLLHLE